MMRKFTLIVLASGFWGFMPFMLSAQVKQDKQKKEIIIRGDEKGDKTIIVIEGDKVTVNGNEVKGSDKDTIIMKRMLPNGRIYLMDTDSLLPKGFVFEEGRPKVKIFDEEKIWDRTVTRVQLGVRLQAHEKGLEITEVAESSGAAKAGIREKDIIRSIDGKEIKEPEGMVEYIQSKKPGDQVDLLIIRGDQELKLQANLGEMKTVSRFKSFELPIEPGLRKMIDDIQEKAPRQIIIQEPLRNRPRMGFSVEELETGKGLKVVEVLPKSAAEKAGIRKGDVISSINNTPLTTVDDIRNQLEKEEKEFDLNIERNGKNIQLKLGMPKPLRRAEF